MKIKWLKMAMLCIALVTITCLPAACTQITGEEPAMLPAGGEAFPLEIVDQAGRAVRIEKSPEKIISLAPSNTEILYALGLEDRLVGVTEYCDYPEAARQKPKVGGYSTVDIEKVVDAEPDLIFATNIHKDEVTPRLEGLGLTVVTLDPTNVEEVMEAINLMGRVAGKGEAASHITAEMEGRVKAVTDKTSALSDEQRPRVFYVLWYDPITTVGAGTRINDLIVKAGGNNIAGDLPDYPNMSLEAVISMNPQVIIADVGHGSREDMNYQYVLTEKRFKDIEALRNNRVHGIDSDIVSRPGPRIIEGLESFAKLIHPELFP
ncbi:MAG: cobalamin-binding protein [Dehalococcoidia bacterium]|nr:cobalamin-binding protein [Dehalococcoidia bacterium]